MVDEMTCPLTPAELIAAVHAMIDSLPSEMQRAEARVGLMLTLRHTEEP